MNNEINQRREFLKQNTLAGLGVLTLGALGSCATSRNTGAGSGNAGSSTLAGMDLEDIYKRYRSAMFDRFIPNMEKYVVDKELGGFMCWVNIATGKHDNTNKRSWFEGRGIWTYSFLYNNFEKNPRYLEIARKTKDFILKILPSDDRFLPGTFTREGVALSKEEGDIYGNLFLAEGLAEFAKATGEIQYFDLAKKIFLKALARFDRSDFAYPYKAAGERVKGPRIFGHWMIMLSVATQMLKQHSDPEIQKAADRCVDAIMNHHLNPKYKLVNEALAHDFSPLNDSVAQLYIDIGHGCETFAFVMNYAIFKKDAKLFNEAKELFRRHVTVAKDAVFGGHFYMLENVEKHTWPVLNKVRWLQEEIMIGAFLILEHTGEPWAIDVFKEADAYVYDKFVHPEWLFIVDSGDREMKTPSMLRAENYHHPRHLMVTMLAIDRIIKRGRKPSGILG